jgi:hypothetical protein
MKVTEKAVDLLSVDKRKVRRYEDDKEVEAEEPFVKESTNARMLYVGDGGTMLVPVHYRPQSLQAKDRWWVLSISTRIYIEEEERRLRAGQ